MMFKRVKCDKRGLSPVIASVLLIMLVLVLAAMVFLWARGFISEQIEKFGVPVETLCADVDFDVSLFPSQNNLEVVNRGNIDIFNLEIKKTSGGNSESALFDFAVDAGQAVSGEVDLRMEDETMPEKVTIYPSLVGTVVGKSSNKVITCLDQGITVEL